MNVWELIVILVAAIVIVILLYLLLSRKPMEEKKTEQKTSNKPAPESEKIAEQPPSTAEVPTGQVPTTQASIPIAPPQIIQQTSIATKGTMEQIIAAVKGEPSKVVEEAPKPESESLAVQPPSVTVAPTEQVLPAKEDLTVAPPEIPQEPSTVGQEIAAPIAAVAKEESSKVVEVTPKQEPSGTPEEEKKTPRRRGRPKGSGKKKPQPVESPTV
ncbi:MAG: hypothetical protein ABSB40_12275 [Nitrososphaeria archaeon]